MKQEKRKRRQDGWEAFLFKDVRLHETEAMGNKRLGGLLLRQTIHSGCKQQQQQQQRSTAEAAEWKSEDGGNECGEERDDLQARIAVLYIMYCTVL